MARIHIEDELVEVVMEVAPADLMKAVQRLTDILTVADMARKMAIAGEIVLTFAAKKED